MSKAKCSARTQKNYNYNNNKNTIFFSRDIFFEYYVKVDLACLKKKINDLFVALFWCQK
jgi:hypothetical protein